VVEEKHGGDKSVLAKEIIPYDDWLFITELIQRSRWIFAKTMPENPHYYMLRKESDDGEFVRFVEIIRQYGYQYQYEGYWYTVLNVYDWYYWTMGAPMEETILINRKERKLNIEIPNDTASEVYKLPDVSK
jgi:hypothetical protein